MGVIIEVSSLLVQLYKLWQEHRGTSTVTPHELYEKYVHPSYVLVKEVHSDYEDLYLELSERINRDEQITGETLEWFTRARTRRAVDRSELSLIDLPQLGYAFRHSDRIADINAESLKYVEAVQRYFQPETQSFSSTHRIYELLGSPTASMETEIKLIYLHIFSKMSDVDRRAMEAERAAKTSEASGADQVLDEVMRAVKGDISEDTRLRIEASSKASLTIAEDFENFDRHNRRVSFSGPNLWRFRWRDILDEHIQAQRESLSEAMKEIQLRHVRLRILADR